MVTKRPLTLAEHRLLGAQLHSIRQYLVSASVRLSNAYPVSGKSVRRIDKACRALDELRSEMENHLVRDRLRWWGDDRAALDRLGLSVYYPATSGAEYASRDATGLPEMSQIVARDGAPVYVRHSVKPASIAQAPEG
jgi:hypothetical protein